MRTNHVLVTILWAVMLLSSACALLSAEVECSDRPECWPEGSAMRTGLLARQAEEKQRIELQQAQERLVELPFVPADSDDQAERP